MTGAIISAAVGIFLILAGVVQVFVQGSKHPPEHRRSQVADVGLISWRFETAYPGIIMICVGAFLLSVSTIAEIFSR